MFKFESQLDYDIFVKECIKQNFKVMSVLVQLLLACRFVLASLPAKWMPLTLHGSVCTCVFMCACVCVFVHIHVHMRVPLHV